MQRAWWERPACFLCDYWWAILAVFLLGMGLLLTRNRWLPLLGYQPLGTGDVQVTLRWETTDDLDLYVIDPNGFVISYMNPLSPSAGVLDVDANAACFDTSTRPVENIFWSDGDAPYGQYAILVRYYADCGAVGPVPFTVRVKVDGRTEEYDNVLNREDDEVIITTFGR